MPSGGSRKGAGRKLNSGIYKEPTKAIRIPLSLVKIIQQMLDAHKNDVRNIYSSSSSNEAR